MNQNQQANKIANPQSPNTPQVKSAEMNDRDRLNDILSMEKYLCSSTNIAAWEASHQQLHQDIMMILTETQACHRQIYTLMFQQGWYTLEAAEQQQLDQAHQQFANYSTQFPYSTPVQ